MGDARREGIKLPPSNIHAQKTIRKGWGKAVIPYLGRNNSAVLIVVQIVKYVISSRRVGKEKKRKKCRDVNEREM